MKKMLIVLGLAALSICVGQTLEKVIGVPDTFPGLAEASFAFHNPVTDRMYFAGYDCYRIQIYDVGASRKHSYVDDVEGCYMAVHCRSANRIWFVALDAHALVGFDDRADTLVAIVRDITDSPYTLAYSETSGRLYVGIFRDELVFAVDPEVGQVVDSIPVSDCVFRMCWDSVHNRVYCGGPDWDEHPLTYIDCFGDSVGGVIPGTGWVHDIVVHPTGSKLYCLAQNDSLEGKVIRVVDTDALAVVDSVVIPLRWPWYDSDRLFVNPGSNRLYAGYFASEIGDHTEDTVAVVDISADTLTALIKLPHDFNMFGYAVDPTDGKVYLSSWEYDDVLVIGPDDSIVARIEVDGEQAGGAWHPGRNQVYMPCMDWVVHVVDCSSDSIVEEIDYDAPGLSGARWNPDGAKLYTMGGGGYFRLWCIGPGDTILCSREWPNPPPYSEGPFFVPELNRLYFETVESVYVYDCGTDSVLYTGGIPPEVSFFGSGIRVPGTAKLYLGGYYEGEARTMLYDLDTDSVTRAFGRAGAVYWHNSRTGLIYALVPDTLYMLDVIDPVLDSVVASLSRLVLLDLAVNTVDNEVYALGFGPGWSRAYVIDGDDHVILDSIILGTWCSKLAWWSGQNRLYAVISDGVMVIDCRTRQIVRTVAISCSYASQAVLNPRNDKLWVIGSGVSVLRVGPDSVLAEFPELSGSEAVWDTTRNRAFVPGLGRVTVFRDRPIGVQEPDEAGVLSGSPGLPTVVRRSLPWQSRQPADLLNITGRKVMNLKPGLNDIRHLAPGVYFLRTAESGKRSAVRKVVIQR